MKIAVVGLGLIGGSIAKALSRKGNHEVIGFDMDEQVLLEAISLEAIKRKGRTEDLKTADVVYVCLYPKGTIDFIKSHQNVFGENTIVTDVCGVKEPVYEEIIKIAKDNNFQYVGSHPMAGKEKSGFYESESGLFFGASYIMVGENPLDYKLTQLAEEMEFGRIVRTNSKDHDQMIAFTSQVPHVLACSYVMSPRCENHVGFSAGSYRDVSRVACINSELWADLFLSNKEALLKEIDCLMENIGNIKHSLENNDEEELVKLLSKARIAKEKDFKQ